MIKRISERLTVLDVLDACGIEYGGKSRIACPVHGGEGLNFAIHENGTAWNCFSHNCGNGRKRDGINLFCLLHYGKPLPDLEPSTKGEALKQLCTLAGIDFISGHSGKRLNIFERMPDIEKNALSVIFKDTRKLGKLGKSRFFGTVGQKIILFLHIAKQAGKLPEVIGMDWAELKKLEEYCCGK